MPEAGDRLAPALEESQRLLDAGGYARHGQVIVLSDGISDPVEALRAAQELRKQGSTVNVIGVGAPGRAPELQRIASAGGGEFVPVTRVSSLLAALEAQQARNLEADNSSVSKTRLSTWQNEGVWLLPPLLLLAAWLARRGWV
jgi:Ca-activated chloride channel family protein